MTTGIQRALLIVPEAHYRVHDARFQLVMYELFHRTIAGRLGHALSTPVVMVGLFTLTSLVSIGPVPVSVAFAIAMAGWYFFVDRASGAVMVPLLALAWTLGMAIASVEHAVAIGAALVVIATYVQTWSHTFEDVPPPTSERPGWVPPLEWIRTARLLAIVRGAVLGATFFPVLELWAAPRVWQFQAMHAMLRLGWRPELRREVDAEVRSILARGSI
jgi:uncharacterized membrane protein YGL010W